MLPLHIVLVEDPVDEKRPPQTPPPPRGTKLDILARAHMGLFGEINRFVVHLGRPPQTPLPPSTVASQIQDGSAVKVV